MINRYRIRRDASRVVTVLALVFLTCSFDAAAQDALRPIAPALRTPSAHPEAPVGGGDPILPDIVAVRGAVHGIGSADSVRIALDVHFARIDRDSLTFPTAGLSVDSARVDGRTVRPVRGPGYTTVPVRADSSHSVPAPADRVNDASDERRVTLFYVVKSGLNRRHDGEGPAAVWTTPGNVDSHWLPLHSASDDLLHADLAFPLPVDWTLVNDPDSGGDSTGVHILRPVEAVTARDLGFLAVRTDALHGAADSTGDADPVVYGIGSGVLDRPADSLRADVRAVSDFLAGRLSL
ncbi:MAG: hypothetical protein HKN17_03665, partial [Rhodothermales bacterium]|nr:hypothetical protein [Rhodothermales bacterium]